MKFSVDIFGLLAWIVVTWASVTILGWPYGAGGVAAAFIVMRWIGDLVRIASRR